MDYPESVLTKNKKGETEVRTLLRRGEFVEYNYTDPATGKTMESGKKSIILKFNGKKEHYFVIPLQQKNKFLMIMPEEEKSGRAVWDGKKTVKF